MGKYIIDVQVGAELRIPKAKTEKQDDQWYQHFLQQLRVALTKDDPRYYAAISKGRRPPAGVRRTISLYSTRGKYFFVPSGMFDVLKKVAVDLGYELKWKAATRENKGQPMDFGDMGVTLRDYQLDAIGKMFARKRGIMVAGCGAGKTSTATAFALNSGQATLVLTHSMDLLTQWVECFSWISQETKPVRIIGGTGKKDLSALKPGEICVATIQTLSRDIKKYKEVITSAGACIIDEAHHAVSPTWRKVIEKIPARYRIGLTATPQRADGLGFMLDAVVGRPIFRITSMELVEMGHLRRPTVVPVQTGYGIDRDRHSFHNVKCNRCSRVRKKLSWEKIEEGMQRCTKCKSRLTKYDSRESAGLNFSRLETDLMSDRHRLQEICDLAMRGAMAGRKVCVLISRNESCEKLVDMLNLMGIKSAALTGKIKKKDRERILNGMRFGSTQVIVSANLLNEGTDVANLDLLILASAGKFGGLAAQRIGRLSRQAGADTPIMLDLVDTGAVFERQFKSRAAAYTEAYGNIIQRKVSMDGARRGLDKLREK